MRVISYETINTASFKTFHCQTSEADHLLHEKKKITISDSEKKMLKAQRSFSLWLWFISILVAASAFSLNRPSYNITKPLADYHIIAPELSRNHSLAIAYVDRAENLSGSIKIYVAIIGENSRTHSQCSLDLSPEGNVVSVGVSSLKRLSAKRMLLTVYNAFESGDSKLKLIHLNLQDCQFTPLPEIGEHLIVTYHDSDKFDILIYDRRVCYSANGRCRLSYDGLNNTLKPFDIDLDWKTLRVEYTPSRDFLISGLDTVGVFKFTLLDRTFGSRRDFLAIPNAKNMEFVTSQFSICWIEKPGKDKSVHCSEFDEDGELLFRNTVTYREPVTLVSLQSLAQNRNLLLAGKTQCEGDWDCWNLFVTQVQPEMKIWSTQYSEHFDCSTGDRRLIFEARQVNDSVVAEYVCDNGKHFTYKNYIIDTTDQ